LFRVRARLEHCLLGMTEVLHMTAQPWTLVLVCEPSLLGIALVSVGAVNDSRMSVARDADLRSSRCVS
jgi:hypothetical protein